jgi:hypothetical protein
MQDTHDQTHPFADLLTEEQKAFISDALARNHATFGGFRMELDDDGDDDGADGDEGNEGGEDGDGDGDENVDWKAKFEAQQRINRTLERRGRKDQARLRELAGTAGKAPDKSGGGAGADDKKPEVDADKIREEARAEAAREALNDRVEAKIEAKAAKFADPEDTVAILLRSHKYDDFLDENNKIDVEAITEALKDLGEKKPHLLAQGNGFQGSADGGARKESKGRAKSLGDAIARHYTKS